MLNRYSIAATLVILSWQGLAVDHPIVKYIDHVISEDSSHAKPASIDASKVFGRIQFVNSFPDYKVQVVDSFQDILITKVDSCPDAKGKWQIVDSFPDFKIQLVDSFPDFTIKYRN